MAYQSRRCRFANQDASRDECPDAQTSKSHRTLLIRDRHSGSVPVPNLKSHRYCAGGTDRQNSGNHQGCRSGCSVQRDLPVDNPMNQTADAQK